MNNLLRLSGAAALALLAACAPENVPENAPENVSGSGSQGADAAADGIEAAPEASAAPAVVDLRVRDNPDAPYRSVSAFTVPDAHEIGDGLFPYEGVGWENGYVGYRIYLDERLVADIFGKQTSAPALAGIGADAKYHDLADWGMDVLKVGPSLGIGGLGVMRAGAPAQFGAMTRLTARIDETGGAQAAFTIEATGVPADLSDPDSALGDVTAAYVINQESPLTRVSVSASGDLPLASGVVMHEGATFFQSADDGVWRYVATWGDVQSENKDGLGMALFYRAETGAYGGLENATHFVAFNAREFDYGFLAAWARDASGVTDEAGFKALLDAEQTRLNSADAE